LVFITYVGVFKVAESGFPLLGYSCSTTAAHTSVAHIDATLVSCTPNIFMKSASRTNLADVSISYSVTLNTYPNVSVCSCM